VTPRPRPRHDAAAEAAVIEPAAPRVPRSAPAGAPGYAGSPAGPR
jgi:hypothetical protein